MTQQQDLSVRLLVNSRIASCVALPLFKVQASTSNGASKATIVTTISMDKHGILSTSTFTCLASSQEIPQAALGHRY